MTNANKTPSLPPPGATWTLAGAKARLSEVINRAQAAPRARFADRILPIDHAVAVAERWGDLMAQSRRSGVALSVMDAFFAATALAKDLTLVTATSGILHHSASRCSPVGRLNGGPCTVV